MQVGDERNIWAVSEAEADAPRFDLEIIAGIVDRQVMQ